MKNERIEEMLSDYSLEVKKIAMKVLEKEEEKISLINPRGIMQEIRDVIDEVIQNDNK